MKKNIPFILPLIFSLFVLYFPIFFGFLISPNDIYLHYDPWRYGSFQKASLNPILNDPATSYFTKAYLFKTERESLFFNPYIASGTYGILDLFSGILNPFVLISLLFPIEFFFSIMVFLKILFSYTGVYLFLKKLNLNPWACSFGSTCYAFFGQNVVWSLWPQTNISSLFPFFLYSLKIENKAFRFLILHFLFLFSFTGGYPPYVFIFFYFYFFYILFTDINKIKNIISPLIFSILILLPFIYITFIDLKESGRLELRENLAENENPLPLKCLILFFSPYKFGAPQDFQIPATEGFHSAALYFGIFGFIFLILCFFEFKDKEKRFFIISTFILFFLLFFNSPLRFLISKFPGISNSLFSRISIIFGLTASISSAFGFNYFLKKLKIIAFLAIISSIELSFFYSKFLSYQKYKKIKPEQTNAILFLKENLKNKPFRVLGLYDSLWPNSSEYTKIPDIRSHFTSEKWYREFLKKIDPASIDRQGTISLFWDAKKIHNPFLSSLFVKYITEPPFINTVMPEIIKNSDLQMPENFIEIPKYGLKRKFHFKGTPFYLKIYVKDIKSKIFLNIYEEFSGNLLERGEVIVSKDEYFFLINDPFSLNYSRVFIEVLGDGKIGVKGENFCISVSYSPFFKVYDNKDLKIFENRAIVYPCYLVFNVTKEEPKNFYDLRYFAYLEEKNFYEAESFLNEKKEIEIGKVNILKMGPYGGEFKIITKSNSILLLPYKYNPFWAEALLNGEKVKIYKANGAISGILIPAGENYLSFNFGKKFIKFILISLFLFSISIIYFIFLI